MMSDHLVCFCIMSVIPKIFVWQKFKLLLMKDFIILYENDFFFKSFAKYMCFCNSVITSKTHNQTD